MGKRAGVWLGVILVLGGFLMGCGTKKEGEPTIGPPTQTVEQVREWPQGFEPAGGGLRFVDVPPEAKENLVEASADSAGSRAFFHTLRRK